MASHHCQAQVDGIQSYCWGLGWNQYNPAQYHPEVLELFYWIGVVN